MSQSGHFALVPRPSGELETAEPEAKRILSGMVADPDATVLTFVDTEAALQELEREDPELFTTDWNHPGRLHGDGLLRNLAVRGGITRFFVISASAEKVGLRDYLDEGLNVTLLPKPFSLDDLRRLLRSHVGVDYPELGNSGA